MLSYTRGYTITHTKKEKHDFCPLFNLTQIESNYALHYLLNLCFHVMDVESDIYSNIRQQIQNF